MVETTLAQSKKRPHRKRLLLVGTIIVVVLGGVAAGLWFVSQQHSDTKQAAKTPTMGGTAESVSRNDPMVALQKTATQTAQQSGVAAGQKVYDQQLQKTTDKNDKAQIYLMQSALAGSTAGGNDQASALTYAYDAEKAAPSTGTAITIAQLEEQAGNKANAIKYYNLYLSRMTDAQKQVDQGDFEYYSAHVKQLEAQQ